MSNVSSIKNKQIVVAVTGSIAAYKAADLIRRLKEFGAEVRVVMTHGAAEFITPLTLQTLSGHPVSMTLLDADEESAMGHIALARWADWILVAPATADCLSRLVAGRADDLLSAVCLATEAPIAVAPAMNNKMWSNTATQNNLSLLRHRGIHVIGPASGDQACGEQGEGRLLEPLAIIEELSRLMVPGQLIDKHVMITAGPTYEPIDPVRFIGNRSSGKMGFALAQAARESGANVTLISGPVSLTTPTGVKRIDVETTEQMANAVDASLESCDIFISCAAVADYRPKLFEQEKIKKTEKQPLQIELQPTKDIVSAVTTSHNRPSFVVGFAAETQNLVEYAQSKLERKKLDMIAANWVGQKQGFAADENALHVILNDGEQTLPLMPKTQLARELMTLIIKRFYAKNSIKNS